MRVSNFVNILRWKGGNHKVICLDLSTGMFVSRYEANFLSEVSAAVFKTFRCLSLGFCFAFREVQMSVLQFPLILEDKWEQGKQDSIDSSKMDISVKGILVAAISAKKKVQATLPNFNNRQAFSFGGWGLCRARGNGNSLKSPDPGCLQSYLSLEM